MSIGVEGCVSIGGVSIGCGGECEHRGWGVSIGGGGGGHRGWRGG